jgi:uncharacterized protein YbjT (DUF2867 family)
MPRVAIFGASGAAGSEVLRVLLHDPRITEVFSLSRRPATETHPKLRDLLCADFLDLSSLAPSLRGLDACFYCLGVSQSQVSDPKEYRRITYEYTMAAARVLRAESPGLTFHFLSGQGTNPTGRLNWARVKGETELAVQQMGFQGAICWRPAYIHNETPRAGRQWIERFARTIYPALKGIRSLSITGEALGQAMLQATLEGLRSGIIENAEIRTIAGRYTRPAS